MTKAELIKRYNPQIIDITTHTVSAEWARMNVDYSYQSDAPVEIVQATYDADLYASPVYLYKANYDRMSARQLAEAWEV